MLRKLANGDVQRLVLWGSACERWATCAESYAERVREMIFEFGWGLKMWPLPNVWLGVSVEDQETANKRIPLLLDTPASVRWISAEPLLGSVWLRSLFGLITDDEDVRIDALNGTFITSRYQEEETPLGSRIDWVVVGGESGPKARPMDPEWVRSLRDQCAASGVPFLFKQWGEFLPITSADTPDGMVFWPDDGGETGRFEGQNATAIEAHGRQFSRIGKKRAGRLLDGMQHDGYPAEIGGAL